VIHGVRLSSELPMSSAPLEVALAKRQPLATLLQHVRQRAAKPFLASDCGINRFVGDLKVKKALWTVCSAKQTYRTSPQILPRHI